MTNHCSERVYDDERPDLYAELVQSSLDRPQGGEQSCLLDLIASTEPLQPRHSRIRPKLEFRWFMLPRFPVPFLTWA